jgi:hypothetical protein
MLMTGNYRCVLDDGIQPIVEAVHGDVNLSREMYEWVSQLCIALGAQQGDLVPFDKYAAAAKSLQKPSSVARALDGGAMQVERVDLLVQLLARQKGVAHAQADATVARVQAALSRNRSQPELRAA